MSAVARVEMERRERAREGREKRMMALFGNCVFIQGVV